MSHVTADIDDDFYRELRRICAELGAYPRHMLAVMFSESGVRAAAHNDGPPGAPPEKRYNASGIQQLMPANMPGVGWPHGHAAFRRLTATQQLPYVRRYFLRHKGRIGTVAGIYLANFMPALMAHAGNPDYVLCAQTGPYPVIYAANAVFDADGDLRITVRELEEAVVRNCVGMRWAELVARLDGHAVLAQPAAYDLRTVLGVQRALAQLGYDPGPLDGYTGPRTRGAVSAFQRENGLVVDGLVGPRTRSAMEVALVRA